MDEPHGAAGLEPATPRITDPAKVPYGHFRRNHQDRFGAGSVATLFD